LVANNSKRQSPIHGIAKRCNVVDKRIAIKIQSPSRQIAERCNIGSKQISTAKYNHHFTKSQSDAILVANRYQQQNKFHHFTESQSDATLVANNINSKINLQFRQIAER
jgi:hypothetical protein